MLDARGYYAYDDEFGYSVEQHCYMLNGHQLTLEEADKIWYKKFDNNSTGKERVTWDDCIQLAEEGIRQVVQLRHPQYGVFYQQQMAVFMLARNNAIAMKRQENEGI